MWDSVAKEMGIPWRAAEAMHWQLGEQDMAQRANTPVFQLNSPSTSASAAPAFTTRTSLPPAANFQPQHPHAPGKPRRGSIPSKRRSEAGRAVLQHHSPSPAPDIARPATAAGAFLAREGLQDPSQGPSGYLAGFAQPPSGRSSPMGLRNPGPERPETSRGESE